MIGGELVREARKRAGLTQRELGARAGVSQPAVARLESGRTSPSLEDVQRLMRLCGFDLRVEVVPDDDSDRVQARSSRRLTPEAHVNRNAAVVRQAEEMRRAFAEAQATLHG